MPKYWNRFELDTLHTSEIEFLVDKLIKYMLRVHRQIIIFKCHITICGLNACAGVVLSAVTADLQASRLHSASKLNALNYNEISAVVFTF